jgi:hypothetical protein
LPPGAARAIPDPTTNVATTKAVTTNNRMVRFMRALLSYIYTQMSQSLPDFTTAFVMPDEALGLAFVAPWPFLPGAAKTTPAVANSITAIITAIANNTTMRFMYALLP